MISILAASLLGPWTYAGFLAEPTPAPPSPPAAATTPPPASAPVVPSPAGASIVEETPRRESPPPQQAPASPTPQAPPPPIAPRPTLYRSTDASGQAWEHTDPAYLSSFVEARNRSFVAAPIAPPVTYTYTFASPQPSRASRCSTGRCN